MARELLHEQVPFDNDIALARNFVLVEQARPLLSDDVPVEMAKMIRMCWQNNPDHRLTFAQIYSFLKDA